MAECAIENRATERRFNTSNTFIRGLETPEVSTHENQHVQVIMPRSNCRKFPKGRTFFI
jgi:hypothetical protein